MAQIKELQTDNYTIKSGHLDVGNGHKVYFEQWGNPKAKTPIICFHGGPGSRYKAYYKTIAFDPKVHQVIFFDQRGCGNSLPYGKLEHNTTQDIISDASKILAHLGIKRMYAYGRSWGCTLATLFTIQFPHLVKATIVGGVYTGSRAETDYVDNGYFKNFYPEVWDQLQDSVPKKFRDNPTAYHYDKLAYGNTEEIATSAKALEDLELPLLRFDWQGYPATIPSIQTGDKKEPYDHVPYQIYAHYLSQGCFLPDGYILQEASKVKSPFAIVQGRYDMACPFKTAYALHQAIPQSKLYVTLAGHSSNDPENRTVTRALIDMLFI
ncbi:MAG TPA: alpha/beta fold hydrolase [Candidatus Limnocylindria bacterium]|nr:alpha/beta fold hydrolase [Candidatus Limnocylindria bacterium]